MQPRTRTQWFFEGLSLALLLAVFAMIAIHWSQLPDRIPTHFNASGAPNGWRGKGTLVFFGIITAVLWVILTLAERHQRMINIPFDIDRDSPRVQDILRSMAILMKVCVMAVFAWLMRGMVETAFGRAAGLGRGFLPLSIALIFAPLIVYTVRLWRLSN